MAAAEEEGWRNLKDKNGVFEDGYFPIAVATRRAPQIHRDGYLTADVRARPNFNILGEAQVERVLFSGTRRHRRSGSPKRRNLRHSGERGDRQLRRAAFAGLAAALGHRPRFRPDDCGIDVVADRLGVGKNQMEHPASISAAS